MKQQAANYNGGHGLINFKNTKHLFAFLIKFNFRKIGVIAILADESVFICRQGVKWQGDAHLVAIGIEKVEDVGEVVLRLPLREQEEQDHHVRHG